MSLSKAFFYAALAFIPLISQGEIIIEKIDAPKKIVMIMISGRINYEEDQEFEKSLSKLYAQGYMVKNNAISFNTKGGNSHAAIAIGKIIRQRRLNTYLAPDSVCGSACIFSLIGGVVRNIYGSVSVHRSSFGDGIPIEKIKKFTDWGDAAISKHVYEMGISHQLTDAILTTPHWKSRKLNQSELKSWEIDGADRIFEEFSMRALAVETNTSVDDVQSRVLSMQNNCDSTVRNFTMAQWDCIRLQYYWNMKKIRYDSIPRSNITYLDKKFIYIKQMPFFFSE